MTQAYSVQEKSGDSYKTVQEKENRLVEGLIATKAGGYGAAAGYRKPKTRAPFRKTVYGKKTKRVFVPTQCKFCGAEVSYGSISKSRLRAAGSTWIDTCDSCAVNPDVTKNAKIYV